MIYTKLFNRKQTPQSMPIPGSGQVPNHAGGYSFALDKWSVLDRFLILGSETGTYYVDAHRLTRDNVNSLLELIAEDGERVVLRIAEVSVAGRAPKNDPAIFALAICASMGDDATRASALQALPMVCRTGTHLFQFAATCDGLRGWGRGLRRAIGAWYNAKPAEELELQLVKYQRREGWSHRDLLRLAHPKPATETHRALYKWAVDDEVKAEGMPRVEAMRKLREVSNPQTAARIVREARLPREAVPTEWLTKPEVWEALLEEMPMMAMVRNLATMTRVGVLTTTSAATKTVVQRLKDGDRLRRARVHPVALLMAQRTYGSGHGFRGSGTWTPVKSIVNALDDAFYAAFTNVTPTGKRHLLGIDVSGSMSAAMISGTALSAAEGAAAMAMVAVNSEEDVTTMAFAGEFKRLDLRREMRMDKVLSLTTRMNFGSTDCSLPMTWALRNRKKVDAFVVYTDNETWSGGIHPVQALRQYRDTMGIDAKLIVVGMTATEFTIADPNDPGMLDVVGFDAAVPEVMAQFVS
ncbi:MAG: TROVE domain-containing protein [Fimbriimonas sp.]